MCMKTLGVDFSSATFPKFFYLGKTTPKTNLPQEIFDEFFLRKLVLPIIFLELCIVYWHKDTSSHHCCWFSPLIQKVFLQGMQFSLLLKNQHI